MHHRNTHKDEGRMHEVMGWAAGHCVREIAVMRVFCAILHRRRSLPATDSADRNCRCRRRADPNRADHPLIRIAATAAIVIARATSIHPERAGMTVNALRMAEAGPPGGTPVPVTCEVVFVIWPGIVACMSIGTLQDAPAPRVTLLSDQPLPLKTALPAVQV